jgi:HK97 family phage major capsid protein
MISAVNANGIFYAGGPFGVSAPTRLWGLPAVVTPDQPAKTLFVGDGSMATIWDRMSAQIFISDSHADFFIRNIFVLLAEERVTIANYRPAAFAKVLLV